MAFATPEDVATRLGRDLDDVEAGTVEFLLLLAQGVIGNAADKTDDWVANLDPVPNILKALTVELVLRGFNNPAGTESVTESLGAYSHTERYSSGSTGLWLTSTEQLLVREAVYGTLTGSSTPRSWIDRFVDIQENRDIDEIEA